MREMIGETKAVVRLFAGSEIESMAGGHGNDISADSTICQHWSLAASQHAS